MIRLQQKGHALGSDVLLTLIVKDGAKAESLFRRLWAIINGFEERFSRFKENSELSQVNLSAGSETIISPEFYDLMKASIGMFQATDGIYSPFLLPHLQRAGYKGSWPDPGQYTAALDYSNRSGNGKDTVLKKGSLKLPFDTAVDFGGIGKGYLLDKLSDFLIANRANNYWLSLGGDIICKGYDLENTPWAIGIARAKPAGEILTYLKNEDGRVMAVATSGITKRRGENWHHIIDPRTGRPAATRVLTSSVAGASAMEADVLAKCLVITGPGLAEYCMSNVNVHTAVMQVDKDNKLDIVTVIRKKDDIL